MNERTVTAEVYLPLSRGKVAVIDFDDFALVRGMKWSVKPNRDGTCYARRTAYDPQTGAFSTVLLHRFLTNAAPGELVDHKDRDGLNNRRDNLRIATRSQNGQNRIKLKGCSSRFKGVYWHRQRNKWSAGIRVNNHKRWLGYFHSEEDAACAYDAAAIKYFGEYARLNFPLDRPLYPC